MLHVSYPRAYLFGDTSPSWYRMGSVSTASTAGSLQAGTVTTGWNGRNTWYLTASSAWQTTAYTGPLSSGASISLP